MSGYRSPPEVDGTFGMPSLLRALPFSNSPALPPTSILLARSSTPVALVRISIVRNYFMGH